MTKLKTQKDIYDTEPFKNATEFKNKERQEAIKWINIEQEISIKRGHGNPFDEDAECINDGGCDDAGFCVSSSKEIIDWIKHFFNITDEDLKNE